MHFHTIISKLVDYPSFNFTASSFDEESQSILVHIFPRKNGLIHCGSCLSTAQYYDTQDERKFEFIPCTYFKVFFTYSPRRVRCPHCGRILVEWMPWADGKSPLTREMKAFLAEDAKKEDTKAVAERYDVSWQSVDAALKYAVSYGLDHRELSSVRNIGIDEIAWKKGHNYVTLVYQTDTENKRLIWLGEGRSKDTINRFFDEMEELAPGFSSRLRNVMTDMWKPYTDVIAERAPSALNLLDRFHIVKMANKAMDDIRNTELKEQRKKGDVLLDGSKYCFLKNPENLTTSQSIKLNEIMKMNYPVSKAYVLKEQLRLMWTRCHTYESAKEFLVAWIKTVLRTNLEPLKKVARAIEKKLELVLNYFNLEKIPPCGVVEGLNRIVNLSIRKAFGFKYLSTLKNYLLHQMGKLEMPPFVHRFL